MIEAALTLAWWGFLLFCRIYRTWIALLEWKESRERGKELSEIDPNGCGDSECFPECRNYPERKTETFRINSEDAANWYLRKLANIESEKQRIQSQAAAIVAQLDSDRAGLERMHEADLQEFVKNLLAGGKRKSLTLLQGTCGFRTVPGGLRVSDANAAETYAKKREWICEIVTLRFDAADYRKIAERELQETGEVLPGCDVVPERESFSIRFGKEKE